MMEKCTSKFDLPIQEGDFLNQMWDGIEAFIAKVTRSMFLWSENCVLHQVRKAKKNPFSIRFRIFEHNACKSQSKESDQECKKLIREVLLAIEARSLTQLSSYKSKLEMLSRVRGYADNPETAFLGTWFYMVWCCLCVCLTCRKKLAQRVVCSGRRMGTFGQPSNFQ